MHNGELQSSTSCLKPWYMQANGLSLPAHRKVDAYNRNSSGMRISSHWHDNADKVLEDIKLLQEWGCKVDDVLEQIVFAEAPQKIDGAIIELGNRANNKLVAYTRLLTQALRKELNGTPLDYITETDFSFESSVSFDASGFKVNVGRFESPAIVNLDLNLIREELREPAKVLITNLNASSLCSDIWTVASQADYIVTEIMDESNPDELKVLIKDIRNCANENITPALPDWLKDFITDYYTDELDTFITDESCMDELISRLEAACICLELASNLPEEITDYKKACKQIIKLSQDYGSLSDIEQSIQSVAAFCLSDPFLGVDYEPIEHDGDALLGSGRIVIFATDETTNEFCSKLFSNHCDAEQSNGSIVLSKNGLEVYEAIVKSEHCLATITNTFVNC